MVKDEDIKTLAQIELLQELNLPREQLEATLISLLQWIYNNDEMRILSHLDHMEKINKTIKIVD